MNIKKEVAESMRTFLKRQIDAVNLEIRRNRGELTKLTLRQETLKRLRKPLHELIRSIPK